MMGSLMTFELSIGKEGKRNKLHLFFLIMITNNNREKRVKKVEEGKEKKDEGIQWREFRWLFDTSKLTLHFF